MCSLTGHSAAVYNVTFSPDGTRFVSGAGDGLVKIWDVQAQTEVRTTAQQKCGAVPRRARMQGSLIVVSLNSRLEKEQLGGSALRGAG